MHIFVTGGAGFIGSNLIQRLFDQKYQVTAIDNFSAGEPSKRRAKLLNRSQQTVFELDVHTDKTFLKTLLNLQKRLQPSNQRIDAIVHLAGPSSVMESHDNPVKYCREINIGTTYVLEAARELGITRVVIASSAMIYGNQDPKHLPLKETDPVSPLSPYAVEKYAAECHALRAAREYGLETVVLRFPVVYGQGQDPDAIYSKGVVAQCMDRVRKQEPPEMSGNGSQTRDFVYVDDAVDALIASIEKQVEPGTIMNIGSGKAISIKELADKIIRFGSKKLEPRSVPARPGEVMRCEIDISRAKKLLGYEPRISLEKGLRRTWEWLTKTPEEVYARS